MDSIETAVTEARNGEVSLLLEVFDHPYNDLTRETLIQNLIADGSRTALVELVRSRVTDLSESWVTFNAVRARGESMMELLIDVLGARPSHTALTHAFSRRMFGLVDTMMSRDGQLSYGSSAIEDACRTCDETLRRVILTPEILDGLAKGPCDHPAQALADVVKCAIEGKPIDPHSASRAIRETPDYSRVVQTAVIARSGSRLWREYLPTLPNGSLEADLAIRCRPLKDVESRDAYLARLLNDGLPLTYQDRAGRNAVSIALIAQSGGERFLLESGVPVDNKGGAGRSALYYALQRNNPDPELCLDLVRAGCPVTGAAPDNRYYFTVEHVKAYIEAAAHSNDFDINAVGVTGNTLLTSAARLYATDQAVAVLEHGADPNACDRFGRPALHYAANTGNAPLCELLLRYGADPDLCDQGRMRAADQSTGDATALLFAVARQRRILSQLPDSVSPAVRRPADIL